MKKDEFFNLAVQIEKLSNEDVHAFADGILQHYEYENYIGRGTKSSDVMQSEMAEAIKRFASDVMAAEREYE